MTLAICTFVGLFGLFVLLVAIGGTQKPDPTFTNTSPSHYFTGDAKRHYLA